MRGRRRWNRMAALAAVAGALLMVLGVLTATAGWSGAVVLLVGGGLSLGGSPALLLFGLPQRRRPADSTHRHSTLGDAIRSIERQDGQHLNRRSRGRDRP